MKEMLLRHQEMGVSLSPENAWRQVCPKCIADEALALFVSRSGPIERCDFCSSSGTHGMAVEDLFEYMAGCLAAEWEDPTGSVGWSGRDGGWMGASVIDSDSLLDEIGDPFESEELRDLFSYSFDHEWCQRNPYGLPDHERLGFAWDHFAHFVRYEQRHLFLRRSEAGQDLDAIAPADMLDEVGKAIVNVGDRLLRTLPAGSALFRGREHGAEELPVTAKDLGSPPVDLTRSTRMSPAGLSVFYAAEDVTTVLREERATGRALTVGSWRTTRDLVVLDLAELPPVPSLFDMTGRTGRPWLRFLRHFSQELSRAAGTTPEVDYVPTQIFTEYVRTELLDYSGKPVEGIRFRSSLNPSGFCWVLFVAADGCADAGEEDEHAVLSLERGSQVRFRGSWTES